jgi:gliding motility-associated-like protein
VIKYRAIGAALVAGMSFGLQAQLAVTTNQTPLQLVQDVLLGSGVTVSNVTFNGVLEPATPQQGTGAFTATNSNLGLGAGVILSSGFAEEVAGPATGFQSDQLVPNVSDPDLVAISGGNINNSAVLEFDFVTTGDSIKFRYVFGSEEYPEFVCSFNDAFGFFLSGPGISGPYTGGAINIALLPDGITPVTINNVNNGDNNNPNDPACPAVNPQFYVDNTTGTTVVYDGFTVVLEARQAVQCGQTYHIKLAIGDAIDQAYDSGVFLEAGSFTSTPFIPNLTPGPGIIGTNTIQESCYPVTINFQRTGSGTSSDSSVVHIDVAGTATAGVDYTPAFPDSLLFLPGDTAITFTFNCPIDSDGEETIVLTLTSESPCAGQTITNEFTFFIIAAPALVVTGGTQVIDCQESATLVPVVLGGYPPYSISWNTGVTADSLVVTPLDNTTYTATVTDDCGTTSTAQFFVELTPLPPLNMLLLGPNVLTESCGETSINIIRPQGVPGDVPITLTFGAGSNGTDFDMPASVTIPGDILNIILPFQPLEDSDPEGQEVVTVTGTYTDPCGRTVSASVTITINDAPAIVLQTADQFVECSNDSIPLTVLASGGVGSLDLLWSNGDEGAVTFVPTQATTTYTVTATDDCGRSEPATVTVFVDCEVIIPNVFTPNSDGVNDVWFIDGITYANNTLRVYNRWGQVVYEARNYRNTWDGDDVPDGTYYYELTVERKSKPYTGHVTILRNGR